MALKPTPGASDADTMASLAEALDHITTLTAAQSKGWPTDVPSQEAALKQAARKMNALDYKGQRVASEEAQPMPFPREGIYDRSGFAVPSDVIPMAVKRAQIELSIWLWLKNRNTDSAPSRLKVGSLEIEGQTTKAFPDHVLAYLAPYLNSYGSSVMLVRG